MAWFPGAIRKVVARHRTPMARYRGVCNHIAVSEAASLYNFFNTPGEATSHFYVRKSGIVEQYVDTQFRAPAQLEGNSSMISIETQGGTKNADTEPWTPEQVETLAQIVAWANRVHGIPLVRMPDSLSSTRGIGYHKLGVDPYRVDGGEKWSRAYGKVCPGAGKIAQIPRIIARAIQINSGAPEEEVPLTKDEISAVAAETVKQLMSEEVGGQSFRGNISTGFGRLAFLYGLFVEGGPIENQLDVIEGKPVTVSIDYDKLATAIVSKMPAADTVDKETVKQGLREVLGALDNPAA